MVEQKKEEEGRDRDDNVRSDDNGSARDHNRNVDDGHDQRKETEGGTYDQSSCRALRSAFRASCVPVPIACDSIRSCANIGKERESKARDRV